MKYPALSEIDQIRTRGYRPQVVACILNDKKILLLYKRKHDLWQLPQGGIENGETVEAAYFRESAEELGAEFAASFDKNIVLFCQAKVAFSGRGTGARVLTNDAGQEIKMKGKKYFFGATTTTGTFDLSKSEFDDYRWTSFEEGLALCETINQAGKKRITLKALHTLRELELL